MCVSIRYVHLVLKRQQPINTCSEEHYCAILQLNITFLHLNTSVTDFVSKFMLYSSTLVNCVIILVFLLSLLVQLVVLLWNRRN